MTDEMQAARRPIESLISKSAKARQKVAPGTWQHAMLGGNIEALRFALALMSGEPDVLRSRARRDFEEALRALASMIRMTENAQAKFAPGTSQAALLRNRLRALQIAEALVEAMGR